MGTQSFFSQPDKQGHMQLGFVAMILFFLIAVLCGCPMPLFAGVVLAMAALGAKEVWDANKPLPPGTRRNGRHEHGMDLLADAIGVAAAALSIWILQVLP